MKTQNIQVDIRQRLDCPTHYRAIITVRGRCWACTWAHEPTKEEVLKAWKEDRKAFDPYTGQ